MSIKICLMLFVSIVGQVIGVALLPKTQGLTQPVYTVLLACCYTLAIALLARISYAGVELGVLIPILAATVPLASIAIGVLFYGDSAAPLKVGLLVAACIAIGVAAKLG